MTLGYEDRNDHDQLRSDPLFAELTYQTLESWSRARRVVAKAEHLAAGEDRGEEPSEQKVTTEHVRVHDGGQAVVGNATAARQLAPPEATPLAGLGGGGRAAIAERRALANLLARSRETLSRLAH